VAEPVAREMVLQIPRGVHAEVPKRAGVELVEGHALADHVHLCLSIPPKYSVANTIGFLKGKSAIPIHREYVGKKRNFTEFQTSRVRVNSGQQERAAGYTDAGAHG